MEMKTASKIVIIVALIGLFVVVAINLPLGYYTTEANDDTEESKEFTANEKTTKFLSSVVELDLTKYNSSSPSALSGSPNSYRYPPEFCGAVKEECRYYKYETDESKIDTMSIFYNEQLVLFKIEASRGNYIYSETPVTDLFNQAKNILQRYQAYADDVYPTDTSYLEPMQNVLNTANDLSPTNVTIGNINFQVSKNGAKTIIQWIYTENDVSMNWKRLELVFRNNAFESMIDNWPIYNVSGPSVINSEEAYQLALDTAQNCEFRIINLYRNETVKLPDLSDSVYQLYFTMVPYRNETLHNPSKLSRDPLTLYPYWQFDFYFKEGEIGGYSGIQVGIWGDTKEIVYCNGFGYLGTPGT